MRLYLLPATSSNFTMNQAMSALEMVRHIVHLAYRIEKRPVNDNSHLPAPPAQRWNFYLELGHKTLGRATAVVWTPSAGGKNDPLHGGIERML